MGFAERPVSIASFVSRLNATSVCEAGLSTLSPASTSGPGNRITGLPKKPAVEESSAVPALLGDPGEHLSDNPVRHERGDVGRADRTR